MDIESLVSKGRRVRLPREQREVAFGLADLSTNASMHEKLFKTGGVKTLVGLLRGSVDEEAQRFAALALANVSTSNVHRVEIAREACALHHIISCLKNEGFDGIARNYCAMAVGNLASEPENHDAIAHFGGIQALSALVKDRVAKEGDQEVSLYALFALSNLAASSNHREEIVKSGVMESAIQLAYSEDVGVQCQALAVLRGLLISSKYRPYALKQGILDPLVLLAQTEKEAGVGRCREVSMILNCLSVIEENRREIADRTLSTIVALLVSGHFMIERNACTVIANVLEMIEFHPPFFEERGMSPLSALLLSSDVYCVGVACRSLSNLASNTDVHEHLRKEGVLKSLVGAISKSDADCQRYAALCIANMTTNSDFQEQILETDVISHLVNLLGRKAVDEDACKYASLALANMSATSAYHLNFTRSGALETLLFIVANESEKLTRYYVAHTFANLCGNESNHYMFVNTGVQPVVKLACSTDNEIHFQAVSAMRALSVTGDIKSKLVGEGCLEPIIRLLFSSQVKILREASACLWNLSLDDINKYKIAQCGAIPPLIKKIQSQDLQVACQSIACLTNLAEWAENRDTIVNEGVIVPCLALMKSLHVEVQRESGLLISNLCASAKSIGAIMKGGGHDALISFIISDDVSCQRVGAFGLGTICGHDEHRVAMMAAGSYEPLSSMANNREVELEIRRCALFAIVNLASSSQNHLNLIAEGALPMLLSLFSSDDSSMRSLSALVISRIAVNPEYRQTVSTEGGLEPVLYLSRTEDTEMQRMLLPAIASLSFVQSNQSNICKKGGLANLVAHIGKYDRDPESSRLACCAVANLSEMESNLPFLADSNAISLLVSALAANRPQIQRESARSLGNISVFAKYGKIVLNGGGFSRLLNCFCATRDMECRRLTAMAIVNLTSTSIVCDLFTGDYRILLETLLNVVKSASDYKRQSAVDTIRFVLLVIANVFAGGRDEGNRFRRMILKDVIELSRSRDIKCRHHSSFAISNVCSDIKTASVIVKSNGVKILVSLAFPDTDDPGSTNVQVQAIAGIRGLALTEKCRIEIVRCGALEPLILAATANSTAEGFDIDVQREAAAALSNLALTSSMKLSMCKLGVIPALLTLASSKDTILRTHSVTALGNLAEGGGDIQFRMLEEGCLRPLFDLVDSAENDPHLYGQISRCLCLFACYQTSHPQLMRPGCLRRIIRLAGIKDGVLTQRYAAVAIGNLTYQQLNHNSLFEIGAIRSLLLSFSSTGLPDVNTYRGCSYAFSNVTNTRIGCQLCGKISGFDQALITLLHFDDANTNLRACIATKQYCAHNALGLWTFVNIGGIQALLSVAHKDSVEVIREACAAMRNASSFVESNLSLMEEDSLKMLWEICRSSDTEVSHQSCGFLANLAKCPSNQKMLMRNGVLQQLKYILRSCSHVTQREALRACANLSFGYINSLSIGKSGILVPVIEALYTSERLCRRYAAMTLSNLSVNVNNEERIVLEGGIKPLIAIASKDTEIVKDIETTRLSFGTLANVAAYASCHPFLIDEGLLVIAAKALKHEDACVASSAALCLCNFSSNPSNHGAIAQLECLYDIVNLVPSCQGKHQLWVIKTLRGLASTTRLRSDLIKLDAAKILLQNIFEGKDSANQLEIVHAVMNLSVSVKEKHWFGDINLQNIVDKIISCLHSKDPALSLFGALVIGILAKDYNIRHSLFERGVVAKLLSCATGSVTDEELQRCIGHALSNLSVHETSRTQIGEGGGIHLMVSLCFLGNNEDLTQGLAALRTFAAIPLYRRAIVEAGGLGPLSLALSMVDNNCSIQGACILACSLSLQEQNKIDMFKSSTIEILVGLLASNKDPIVRRHASRAVANCCENKYLSKHIFPLFDLDVLMDLLGTRDLPLARGAARLAGNMAIPISSHVSFLSRRYAERIGDLCLSSDNQTSLHSIAGVLNLSIRTENHSRLVKAGMDKRLITLSKALARNIQSTLQMELVEGDFRTEEIVGANADQLTTFNLTRLQCCCLALGSLASSSEYHKRFIDIGLIQAVTQVVNLDNKGIRASVAFILAMLSRNAQNSSFLEIKRLLAAKVKFVFDGDHRVASHMLVALRFLATNPSSRHLIVRHSALDEVRKAASSKCNGILREVSCCLYLLSLHGLERVENSLDSVLEAILSLRFSIDSEVARFSYGALANVTEDPKTHRLLLEEKSVLKFLMVAMNGKCLAVIKEASRSVSNLLSSLSCHEYFLYKSGLAILNEVSNIPDKTCSVCTAIAFRKLAANAASHTALVDTSARVIISNMLASNTILAARRELSTALKEIACNKACQLKLFGHGALKAAKLLLDDVDLSLKTNAATIIRHFSVSEQIKVLMFHDEGFIYFAKCMETFTNPVLLLECTTTVANMAESERNGISMVQQGIVSLLADLTLRSESSSVHKEAARAMCCLSFSGANHESMVKQSILNALCKLLSSDCNEAARFSSLAIGNLATTQNAQLLIGKTGIVAPLTRLLLASSPIGCQKASCRSLSRLATAHEIIILIKNEREALPLLLNLLSAPETHSVEIGDTDDHLNELAARVICNLVAHESMHSYVLEANGLESLLNTLDIAAPEHRRFVAMALCNLSLSPCHHGKLERHVSALPCLANLNSNLHDSSLEEVEFAEVLCMLLSNMAAAGLKHKEKNQAKTISDLVRRTSNSNAKYGSLLQLYLVFLYNMSRNSDSDSPHLETGVSSALIRFCRSNNNDIYCNRLAMATLCNLSANANTRGDVAEGGGIQTMVRTIEDHDYDQDCRRYACVCLANMFIFSTCGAQEEVIALVFLKCLNNLIQDNDASLKKYCMSTITNIAANEANYDVLFKSGAIFHALMSSAHFSDDILMELSALTISNLTCSSNNLRLIAERGGIAPLIRVIRSQNSSSHTICAAIGAIKRLATNGFNRDSLVKKGILVILIEASRLKEIDAQREIASCLFQLSSSSYIRHRIVEVCGGVLFTHAESCDGEIAKQSAASFANLAEEAELHHVLKDLGVAESLRNLFEHKDITVTREASRCISNLFSSLELHFEISPYILYPMMEAVSTQDEQILYHVALALRKLSSNSLAQVALVPHMICEIFTLIKTKGVTTCVHAASALCNLCSEERHIEPLVEHGCIPELVALMSRPELSLKKLAVASLRHLSASSDTFRCAVVDKGLSPVVKCANIVDDGICLQVVGLFANLSSCEDCHADLISRSIVPALITLSRTEDSAILKECSRTFANLCSNEQFQFIVYRQGGLNCLFTPFRFWEDEDCHRYAATALRLLVSHAKVKKAVSSNRKILEQFVSMTKHRFPLHQRSATSTIASLSLSRDFNQTALASSDSFKHLLNLLHHADYLIQRDAIFIVANIAEETDLHEELNRWHGAQMLADTNPVNGDVKTVRNLARALSCLASNIDSRKHLAQNQATMSRLLKYSRSSDLVTQRYASLSLSNLFLGKQKLEVMQAGVQKVLVFLARFPDIDIGKRAALAIGALSLGNSNSQVRSVSAYVFRPLFKMLAFPDEELRHCAALAVITSILGDHPNDKDTLTREGGGIEPLVALARSKNANCAHCGVYAIGSVMDRQDSVDEAFSLGDDLLDIIVKTVDSGDLNTKRAAGYVLAILATDISRHEILRMTGGIRCATKLASQADSECQEYGAFAIAHMSRNSLVQAELVKEWKVVPILVSIMATRSDARSYAATSLLSLAENNENHLEMAEHGVIQSLLSLRGDEKNAVGPTMARFAAAQVR